MTLAVDTSAQFLREICESPGEDGLRLIYADWMEENGQPERAEFIRLQIRLWKFPTKDEERRYPGPVRQGMRGTFCRRERELLDRWGHIWWTETFAPPVREEAVWMPTYDIQHPDFLRGFVAALSCRMEVWCGRECPECIRRREPSLHPPSQFRCRLCHGTGRVDARGPALVRAAPIETVTLSDRWPWDSMRAETRILIRGEGEIPLEPAPSYWWFDPEVPTSDDTGFWARLPVAIMAHLPESGFMGGGKRAWRCYSEKEAKRAAFNAALAWARQVAGLPPLL